MLSAPFNLGARFDVIAHSPTPFFRASGSDAEEWRLSLAACYATSILALAESAPLGLARDRTAVDEYQSQSLDARQPLLVASPLLGAGAAGAPVELAAEVAVDALARLASLELGRPLTVRLLLSEPAALGAVETALAQEHRQRKRLFLE